MTSFKLGKHSTLNTLWIEGNKLSYFDLEGNNSIKKLYLDNNSELNKVLNLPSSLQILATDKQAVIEYDFNRLPNLSKLQI